MFIVTRDNFFTETIFQLICYPKYCNEVKKIPSMNDTEKRLKTEKFKGMYTHCSMN